MKLLVKILGSSKELLDYCFYRITRFYLTHDSKYVKFYSTQYGGGLTFGLLGFLFVSLVLCPLSALLKVNLIAYRLFWFDKNTPAVCVVLLFMIIGNIYGTKGRYKALCEKYADDPKEKIRGWGVVGLIVAVFMIYGLSLWIFVRPLRIAALP